MSNHLREALSDWSLGDPFPILVQESLDHTFYSGLICISLPLITSILLMTIGYLSPSESKDRRDAYNGGLICLIVCCLWSLLFGPSVMKIQFQPNQYVLEMKEKL